VLILSTTFAAYKKWVNDGRAKGPIVPANLDTWTLYTRDYDVSDIVKSESEAQILMDVIYDKCESIRWDINGGYAELAYNSGQIVLSVNNVWTGHVAFVRFLATFREHVRDSGSFDAAIKTARSESGS
jgi:hypothetical protein